MTYMRSRLTTIFAFTIALCIGEVRAAPQIRCEINLTTWCIATFDGVIEMTDASEQRIWRLRSRVGMEDGPLVIFEEKACHDLSTENIAHINSAETRRFNGNEYRSLKYRITANGCELEFLWPAAASRDYSYKETIHRGILVGNNLRKMLPIVK